MKLIKLSVWAKQNGYSYRGAYNRYRRGDLKQAFTNETGQIMIPVEDERLPLETIIYARVSSAKQKKDLETQARRLVNFCMANGWVVSKIVKEVASGLSDNRPKLTKIIQQKNPVRLVVEHKDRLTRFGFNYLDILIKGEIKVVNLAENNKEDLMQDLISVIRSMVARYYGQRRGKRKADQIIKGLTEDELKSIH